MEKTVITTGSESPAKKALNRLNFTNQEVADFCEVTESMIKKIRSGRKSPSQKLEEKILQFTQMKISAILEIVGAEKRKKGE